MEFLTTYVRVGDLSSFLQQQSALGWEVVSIVPAYANLFERGDGAQVLCVLKRKAKK